MKITVKTPTVLNVAKKSFFLKLGFKGGNASE